MLGFGRFAADRPAPWVPTNEKTMTMDPERDRLKHLLIILLEALSGPQEVMAPIRSRIQEQAEAAGLDEADVHGLLDWIEAQWLGDDRAGWGRDA